MFSSYFNSQISWMQYVEFFIRLMVAAACGAIIGIERTKRFKEAGIRTHMIVCCASALMMIVSKYGFADLTMPDGAFFSGTRGADPARIAAQVVSGISFLGAGMIFKNGGSVRGLTTAAGIWFTAGVGLAIGSGLFYLGIFATLFISLLQMVLHNKPVGADAYKTNYLEITALDNKNFYEYFNNMIEGLEAQVIDMQITREDGLVKYCTHLKLKSAITNEEINSFFEDFPEIKIITNTII